MEPNRRRRKTEEAEISAADRFAALPDGVLARIVSMLPYWDVIQLSVVCAAWRRLRLHRAAPVVNIDLREFVLFGAFLPGYVVLGHRVALRRMRRPVDKLRLTYFAADRCMNEEANAIIRAVAAREIRITICHGPGRRSRCPRAPAGRVGRRRALDGDGSRRPRLHDAPRLPSLRSLTLQSVLVAAAVPFAPGKWCPQLESLEMESCTVEYRQVDVRLQLLKLLVMDDVSVGPPCRKNDDEPFGHVTVDAPALDELVVVCSTGWAVEYASFTLRAPALRRLCWWEQFAGRVAIDVGMPGSVTEGTIEFKSNGELEEMSCREMRFYRAQLMQMLNGILPERAAGEDRRRRTAFHDGEDDHRDGRRRDDPGGEAHLRPSTPHLVAPRLISAMIAGSISTNI
ncbi:hypothetical protein OsI_25490 [Oryza sativa Indica Group]|uniref:F-box domain-containing protein n=1 Tax=Oryza sativa subsp. indica TaxID=39946 RepID=A2YJT9_ORYSI|nr:hypothetical protein OsI_25490 [Oryza sativa Indica Group]